MEKWSVHEDDRPYIRPGRSFNHWYAVAAIGLAAWLGALYFRYWLDPQLSSPPPAAEAPAPVAPRRRRSRGFAIRSPRPPRRKDHCRRWRTAIR